MDVTVVITPNFKREAKKLTKKYRSLKGELEVLIKEIKKEPTLGVKIVENTFKIRLAVKSKGKRKSGGLRAITYLYLKIEDKFTKVYLLSIYNKSDTENISEKFLEQLPTRRIKIPKSTLNITAINLGSLMVVYKQNKLK